MSTDQSEARGVDTRDMLAIHSCFRREYGLAPELVRSVRPGDVERARVVADHLRLTGDFLHHHHTGEDKLLWPRLRDRVAAEMAPTVELMERQHEGIHAATEQIDAALARWREGAAETDRDQLADALEVLHARLTEHLAAEEQNLLPLAAANLTPGEWAQLGEEGMAGLPKKELPMVFGSIMYDADPATIKGMLAHAPLVPRLMLPFLAPRAYAKYARRVYGGTMPPRA
jgi:hemerythrin-like domain-containing protein